MDISNPFSFRYIQNLKSIDVNTFSDSGPSVVFASPGMLQSGVSRQLFDRWASDPKNGVLIAGYAVEHTLAKEIMNQPKEVVTLEGRRQPLNCLVDYVSFSAHVDFVQNRSFITQVDPKHIVLVHGQKDEMGRLKNALMQYHRQLPEVSTVSIESNQAFAPPSDFLTSVCVYPKNKRPTITMPPNLQTVSLKFARRRSAKVMGSLAVRESEPVEGEEVRGILVTHNFHSKIVKPEDLATYTPLRVGSVFSKLHVPFAGSIETLRLFLTEMFAGVTETNSGEGEDQAPIIKFGLYQDKVTISVGETKSVAVVEWEASPAADVIADAVIALLMHAQSSAASIRLTSKPCRHPRRTQDDEAVEPSTKRPREDAGDELTDSKLRLIRDTLLDQFETVEAVYEGNTGTYEITTDCGLESGTVNEDGLLVCTVKVAFEDATGGNAEITVECTDKKLAANVQECLKNLATSLAPLNF